MTQLFIPLTCLVSLLVYYFISYDVKFSSRLKRLKRLRKENEQKVLARSITGWELHDLI